MSDSSERITLVVDDKGIAIATSSGVRDIRELEKRFARIGRTPKRTPQRLKK